MPNLKLRMDQVKCHHASNAGCTGWQLRASMGSTELAEAVPALRFRHDEETLTLQLLRRRLHNTVLSPVQQT